MASHLFIRSLPLLVSPSARPSPVASELSTPPEEHAVLPPCFLDLLLLSHRQRGLQLTQPPFPPVHLRAVFPASGWSKSVQTAQTLLFLRLSSFHRSRPAPWFKLLSSFLLTLLDLSHLGPSFISVDLYPPSPPPITTTTTIIIILLPPASSSSVAASSRSTLSFCIPSYHHLASAIGTHCDRSIIDPPILRITAHLPPTITYFVSAFQARRRL